MKKFIKYLIMSTLSLCLLNFTNAYAVSTDDYSILVNESNKVSQYYEPKDVISLNSYVPCTQSITIQRQAGNAYIKMYNDMKKAGLGDVKVLSGFRSYTRQSTIFNNRIASLQKSGYTYTQAYNIAKTVVAVPATSEHQLGLALDLTLDGTLEQTFEQTKHSDWLKKNAYKYGFVLSFPKEKQSLTGIIYEPWHYRYVGEINAKIMYEKNWTLKEYIDYLKNHNVYEKREGDIITRVYYGNNKFEGNIVQVSNTNTSKAITITTEKFDALKYVYKHWAENDIKDFVNKGILSTNDYIMPDKKITKGEFIDLVVKNITKESKYTYKGFSDVSTSYKYYNSIKKACEMGIITGDGNYMYPNKLVTRQEMFVILSRAMELQDIKLIDYKDLASISGWAFQDFQKLAYAGVINGYSDNTIKPQNNVTLAEAIKSIAKVTK